MVTVTAQSRGFGVFFEFILRPIGDHEVVIVMMLRRQMELLEEIPFLFCFLLFYKLMSYKRDRKFDT